MLCSMFPAKRTKFEQTITNQERTKRAEQNSSLPADQPTLPRALSLNQGDLEPKNYGYVISIHGTSHQGARTMIVVHTAH